MAENAGLKLFVWVGVQFDRDTYGDVLALHYDVELARESVLAEYEEADVNLDMLADSIDQDPDVFSGPVVWADAYKDPPEKSTILPALQKHVYGIWTKPGHA